MTFQESNIFFENMKGVERVVLSVKDDKKSFVPVPYPLYRMVDVTVIEGIATLKEKEFMDHLQVLVDTHDKLAALCNEKDDPNLTPIMLALRDVLERFSHQRECITLLQASRRVHRDLNFPSALVTDVYNDARGEWTFPHPDKIFYLRYYRCNTPTSVCEHVPKDGLVDLEFVRSLHPELMDTVRPMTPLIVDNARVLVLFQTNEELAEAKRMTEAFIQEKKKEIK